MNLFLTKTKMYLLPGTTNKKILSRNKIKFIILAAILIFVIDHFGLLVHLLETDYNRFSYPLDVPMDEILIAMKNGQNPPHEPLNEYNYNYKIKNEKKCYKDGTSEYEQIVILYMIKSALSHRKQRDGIRNSWGWENRFSDVIIKRIFLLGISSDLSDQEKINEESFRYKDLVQADFIDTYYNNTVKTMMGFKWAIQNCPRAQFIVFSDDDMYISTKNLLKFIRNPFNKRVGFRRRRSIQGILNVTDSHPCINVNDESIINVDVTSRLIRRNVLEHTSVPTGRSVLEYDPVLSAFDGRMFSGYVFSSSPMRHKSSKWFVTISDYPYSKYPPYVTAGAYVLSYPALVDLYYTSMFTKLFKFDDVYLGIVAKKCGIVPLHNEHFYFWKKPYDRKGYANVIASHGYGDPDEMKKIWEEQRSLGHA